MERNTGSTMLIWKPRNQHHALLPIVALAFGLSCLGAFAQTPPGQDIDELIKKGDGLLEHHKYKEAADVFRDAIRMQPDNARAHTKLGAVCAANEDYDTAILE